jgi:hypothetical protein
MEESTQNRWKNQNLRTPSRRVANPSIYSFLFYFEVDFGSCNKHFIHLNQVTHASARPSVNYLPVADNQSASSTDDITSVVIFDDVVTSA